MNNIYTANTTPLGPLLQVTRKGFMVSERKRTVIGGSKKKVVPGPYGGELGKPELIKFPDKMSAAITQVCEAQNTNGADLVRRYVTEGLLRDTGAVAASSPDHLVVPGLEESDIKKFGQLAKKVVHVEEPETFARIIINKALNMGVEVMREFVYGTTDRLVESMNEENMTRAASEAKRLDLPKTASAKERKAA